MCLILKESKNGEKPICKTAEKDIVVYKLLEFICDGWQTPYLYLPIKFENGSYKIVANCFDKVVLGDEVRYGIHAYADAKSANSALKKGYRLGWVFKRFYAVIPKGSLYYIGKDGSGGECSKENAVCAEQMIIFDNKETFDKYKKENKVVRFLKKDLVD